jgi:hypothetical protein
MTLKRGTLRWTNKPINQRAQNQSEINGEHAP